MLQKTCTSCKQVKDISEFPLQKRGKYGVRSKCKMCRNEQQRQWHRNNPEKKKIYRKTDAQNNPISHWCRGVISSHRRNGFEVNFTAKELSILVEQTTTCKYCGNVLHHNVPFGQRTKIPKDNHPTVDRINNDKILTLDNIEIICWKCNSTKLNRTEEEFYNYCKMVSNRLYLKYGGKK